MQLVLGLDGGGTHTGAIVLLQMLVVDRYLAANETPPLTVCFNTGEGAAAGHNQRVYESIRPRMRHL